MNERIAAAQRQRERARQEESQAQGNDGGAEAHVSQEIPEEKIGSEIPKTESKPKNPSRGGWAGDGKANANDTKGEDKAAEDRANNKGGNERFTPSFRKSGVSCQPVVNAWYDIARKEYLVQDGRGVWMPQSESQFRRHCKMHRISRKDDRGCLSQSL